RPANFLGDVFKTPVAQVAVEHFALAVTNLPLQLIHLRIDVAVDQKNVQPAVILQIEETASPTEPTCVNANPRVEGHVIETVLAEIAVERGCVVREVGLENVEQPISVVIARGHAHSCLYSAIEAVGAAGFDPDVGECPVFVVAIEGSWGQIVGDVDVRPSVIIEIGHERAETVPAFRFGNPRLLRYLSE